MVLLHRHRPSNLLKIEKVMSGKIVYVSSSLCPQVANQKSYLTSDVVSADDSIV